MAEDLKLSSSTKATILTQNDSIPGCKHEGEPENYTVEQFKCWFKCRGLKQAETKLACVND